MENIMDNETLQERNENKTAAEDKKQIDTSQDKASDNIELLKEFNDILGNHIERLLDTRFGIEELELNIFSISCIVILATRETEIETFPAMPPSRYTESGLIEELSEMSIEPASEISKVIEDMISKNYLKITDDRFFCNKPMSSMAQLFDRIFPNMPGLNLVAYLGQMIDEVTAGRKTQAEASKQFNQMLQIQGVSINEPATPKPGKKKYTYLRLEDETPPEKKVRRPIVMPGKPVNIFSQLKTSNVIKQPTATKEIVSSPIEEEKTNNSAAPAEADSNTGYSKEDEIRETPDNIIDSSAGEKAQATENTTVQEERLSDDFDPPDDKEIEDRILEFEEQLGLKCPLCRTGGIKTNETAKGKTYYHCSNSDCNFISWGKPYYFECPKCGSNFLIEVTDSNGKSFLKCPKATCTHWQKFPWDISAQDASQTGNAFDQGDSISAPKKVVRRKRRVVRRRR